MERLSQGCLNVKVTTGQHPAGIVIVPKDEDIYMFTPIQYPADKVEQGTITTHFDFHAMDDRLVKLDILGHDDPTALRMLQDLTGIDPTTIPLDDPETRKIYSSPEPLHVDLSALECTVGTLGVPEFGTSFVQKVLRRQRAGGGLGRGHRHRLRPGERGPVPPRPKGSRRPHAGDFGTVGPRGQRDAGITHSFLRGSHGRTSSTGIPTGGHHGAGHRHRERAPLP